MRVILGFFGVFLGLSRSILVKDLEVAPRLCFLGAAALRDLVSFLGAAALNSSAAALRLWCIARIDCQNLISYSLLIEIAHVIRRWKALSKTFKLICNVLYKNSTNIL